MLWSRRLHLLMVRMVMMLRHVAPRWLWLLLLVMLQWLLLLLVKVQLLCRGILVHGLPDRGRHWLSQLRRLEGCVLMGRWWNFLHRCVRVGTGRSGCHRRRWMVRWHVAVVMRDVRMRWMVRMGRMWCVLHRRAGSDGRGLRRRRLHGRCGMVAQCHRRRRCARVARLVDRDAVRFQYLLVVAVLEEMHDERVLRGVGDFGRIEPTILPILRQTAITNFPVRVRRYGHRCRGKRRSHRERTPGCCHRNGGRTAG